MTKQEEQAIRNVILRLQDGVRCASPQVRAALAQSTPLRIYLDTWVTGALECLLPETRDPRTAVDLSQVANHERVNRGPVQA